MKIKFSDNLSYEINNMNENVNSINVERGHIYMIDVSLTDFNLDIVEMTNNIEKEFKGSFTLITGESTKEFEGFTFDKINKYTSDNSRINISFHKDIA